MPYAIAVMVQQDDDGEEYSTNHSVKELRGGISAGAMDEQFYQEFRGSRGDAVGWDAVVESPSPLSQRSPLERLILFHSLLQGTSNKLVRCYLSDGSTPGAPVGGSDIIPINHQTLGNGTPGLVPGETSTASLSSVLYMIKTPGQRGVPHGSVSLRSGVIPVDVIRGGKGGDKFISPAIAEVYRDRVQGAIVQSGLFQMFGPGVEITNPTTGRTTRWVYGQARYYTKAQVALNPALKGALASVVTVTKMALDDVSNRQVKRGKRRTLTAVQHAKELQLMGMTIDLEAAKAIDDLKVVPNTGVIPPWDPNSDAGSEIPSGGGGGEPEPAPPPVN